ncbi:WhiB family transcriptional regulator [Streptomyces avermitilis]|uniref:WhiB family transcriptional regulator n=1 Tax=Streptomyces avermitilis TaxID=33903 RepID=UPI00380174C2
MPAPPSRGPARAYVPDAALPCQRRPDVFQHPLLENADAVRGGAPQQRRQHLILLRTARDLCASCPLWAECLQDAVVHAEPPGYTAATTADDRRRLRRALGVGTEDGDLPAREATRPGCTSEPRRLARLRSRASESAAGHAADPALPDLGRILDAFDTLQDQLAARQLLLMTNGPVGPGAPNAAELLQSHTDRPMDSRNEDPMAVAESGRRIAFSLVDPAQAVRQAVLGPLIRSALPALVSVEQLAAMLTTVPGGGVTSETLLDIRKVRVAVTSMLPEGSAGPGDGSGDAAGAERTGRGGTVPVAPHRALTGSVCVELAMSDPVAALRRDFLEPLLGDLASSLSNIEKVATMLAATTGGTESTGGTASTAAAAGPGVGADDPHLETIRAALREINSRLPHLGAHATPSATGAVRTPAHPANSAAAGSGRRAVSVPSIRAAVERAVETFPGAFSARDIRRTLPADAYDDPSKTISNVLSAMVKSGRLQRLSRGTYTRALDLDAEVEADVDVGPAADGHEQAKSA